MKIVRETKANTLEELIPEIQPGEYIILYEGEWDRVWSHPEGVIVQLGKDFFLNGKSLPFKGEWDSRVSHQKGLKRRGKDLVLNGQILIDEDEWVRRVTHSKGKLIRRGNQFRFYPSS